MYEYKQQGTKTKTQGKRYRQQVNRTIMEQCYQLSNFTEQP